jgi:hypothetical protein
MFDYDKIKESALAAVGAIILSATAVGAAVGPARAIETAPVVYAQLDTAGTANG